MLKYKDTADAWNERISAALDFRFLYGREKIWDSLESMYANLEGSGAEVGPNLIHGMAEALMGQLNIDNVAMSVSPSVRDERSLATYPAVQAIDDWLMAELDVPGSMADVTLHSFLWSVGILKLGYDSEWGYDEAFDLGEVDDPWGMTLTQFSRAGKRIEYRDGQPGTPWVMPVLPHDFVVPWGTARLKWAPWAAHRVFRHIDLLRADPKYSKTRRLEPSLSMRDIMNSYKNPGTKRDRKLRTTRAYNHMRDSTDKVEFVELWETRSKVSGRLVVVTDTEVIRNENDLLQVDGLPFKSLSFVQHPRSFWSTPQADYLRFHQAELLDISLQASKQRRANVLKYLVREGSMSEDELSKALSPHVGVVAKFKQHANMATDFVTAPSGSNFELWQEAEASRRNAREAVGLSRNQLGEFDASSRRSATEAAEVAARSMDRMGPRQQQVARLYTDVFRFLNQVVFHFWKTPRIFQVKGEWPSLRGTDLRAEYSYKLQFGAAPSDAQGVRRQQALNFYMMLREDPFVDQVELRDYLTRTFHDIELDQLFKGKQDAALPLPMPQLQA